MLTEEVRKLLNVYSAKRSRTNGLIAYESLDAEQIHTLARE